ncbi:DEAD/DEAH box helicase [Pediococcus acidilactici]|uniref:DEAD/DEAH box helicase n=1 Tax=Pediococcus acidilactici TaxID=1254 RepID=UPI001324813E|nr:DEAD/DEAH box helicase [Pediococcus acidilactici]KAF0338445.1 DEAD/DEAH box helicase [Pediococcus acidilactici]KAF0378325.1 DEAD/DEAH box helicase [Pediococcus acidilactici]KAF0388583.1 DEAD/DEAH box helicase [Pediococcus acidilactici]KAF0451443.1 DEAD/DEAH box helicase [Pediococcus acidilactici]KAF0460752.1 DEAD/DEAH box helicase [Pediococcus acidilactici]
MNDLFQQHFQEKGFKQPTLIQERVAEPLRAGETVLGLSPTGSGKTLAFALPLLEKVIPGNGPQLLVLVPSQELAIQTTDVFREWASLINLKTTSITGGANVQRQIERLKKKKPEIIVGTPGRVLTLINERLLKVKEIQSLVIDEADEILTGEALEDVRQIEDQLPSDVQLSFFSATNDLAIDDLQTWFGVTPQVIDVRAEDQTRGAVQHGWLTASPKNKPQILRQLSRVKKFQGLVFFNHVATMEKITALLKHEGVKVGKIAGHQVQIDRAAAMRRFKKKELSLLMVTDVAARGLDIENLPAVINYDIPRDATTYTHRVGRTGRMGQAGFVISLGDDHDIRNLKKILRELDQPAEKLAIANRQIMTATKARQVAEQAADEKQVSAPVTEEAPQKAPLRDVKTRKAATNVSSVASSKPKKKGKKKHLKRKGKPRAKKSN